MTPKTQSVCKHCQKAIRLDGVIGWLHEPDTFRFPCPGRVAEPASTGEQPPKTVSLWPTCNFCGTEIEKHPSGAGICPKCGAMKFGAARPSGPYIPLDARAKPLDTGGSLADLPEPSAPQTGYCPSHGEKLVPIFGGQWNGCPKCPRDADGFTNAAPQTSAEPQDDSELDGTDFAHPAWWRGNNYGVTVLCQKINAILDGEDDGRGVSSEPWETTRRRLIELVRRKG